MLKSDKLWIIVNMYNNVSNIFIYRNKTAVENSFVNAWLKKIANSPVNGG